MKKIKPYFLRKIKVKKTKCLLLQFLFGALRFNPLMFNRKFCSIIHELRRVVYRPYRRTNHALSHLLHDTQCKPCTFRDISC